MVWPIIAAAAASAAAGAYGNEQARKQSKDSTEWQKRHLQDLINEYKGMVDPTTLEGLNYDYLQGIETGLPGSYDYRPEDYQYLAMPGLTNYAPWQDVKSQGVADSPEARAIQFQALQDLQKRSEEGLTAQDEAGFRRAEMQMGQMARGREEAIMRDLSSRGMGGSGIEAAMRQIASQQGAEGLGQMQANQAAVAAQQRALATQAAMAGGAQLRGQDIALNSTNANIINEFAMKNSAARREIQNMNTELANKVIMDNINEQRRISGQNTGQRNDAQQIAYDRAMRELAMRNQKTTQIGESANQKLGTLYNANADYAKTITGLGEAMNPIVNAEGAANADYQRNIWGAMAQIPQAGLDWYKFNRMYPEQSGTQRGNDSTNTQIQMNPNAQGRFQNYA